MGDDLLFFQAVTDYIETLFPWVAGIFLALLFFGAIFKIWLHRRVRTPSLVAFVGMALGIAAVAAIVWATKPSGGGVVGGLSFVVVACFVANCVDRARLCPGHPGPRQMPHSHRAHGLRISGNGSADHWPVPARG